MRAFNMKHVYYRFMLFAAVVYVAGGVYIIVNSHHIISAYISVYINSEHILSSTWKVILMEQYIMLYLFSCQIVLLQSQLGTFSPYYTCITAVYEII